jgi:D-aminopeptidase
MDEEAQVARRVGLGLSRTDSIANDTSGELFLAFSTAAPEGYARLASANGMLTGRNTESGSPMSRILDAVAEATEEAVWNALLETPTVRGVDGHILAGFRD